MLRAICAYGLQTGTTNVENTSSSSTTGISFSNSVIPYLGAYSCNFNISATTINQTYTAFTVDSTNIGYFSFRYLVTSYSNLSSLVIVRNSANGNVGIIRINADFTLSLRNSSNAEIAAYTTPLKVGQFYQIELQVDPTNTPGTLTLRVDRQVVATGSNDIQGAWTKILIGQSTAAVSCNFNVTDIVINDNVGSNWDNTWLGDKRIQFFQPYQSGDSFQWSDTANAAGTPNNWLLTAELPPDDVTSLIQSGTLNNTDLYRMKTIGPQWITPADTLHGLAFGSRFRNNAGDAVAAYKLQWQAKSGGTKALSAAFVPNSLTWRSYIPGGATMPPQIIAYTDPDGGALTPAILGSMQCGPIISTANVNRIQVTSIWAYAIYTHNPVAKTLASSRTGASPRSLASSRTNATLRAYI